MKRNDRAGFSLFLILFPIVFFAASAFADFPGHPEILPPSALYARDADCSEISPPEIFFERGQWPPRALDKQSLRPVDGLRSPLKQGNADLCYAYAGAEAITQRTGIIVSPLDLATSFYFQNTASMAKVDFPELREYLRRETDILVKIAKAREEIELANDSDAWKKSSLQMDMILTGRFPPSSKMEWASLAFKAPAPHGYVINLRGGDEAMAILLANAKGLCRDSDLLSDDGFKNQYSALLKFRLEVRQKFGEQNPPAKWTEDPMAQAFNEEWVKYVDRACRRVRSAIPLVPVQISYAEDIGDWAKKPESYREQKSKELFSVIDYSLNSGRAPIVGMDWYIFEEPDGHDGDHAAAIIGRKKVGGVCHYLMRDNVNEPCENLRKQYKSHCNNGHIWLTEKQLAKTMYSVSYIR